MRFEGRLAQWNDERGFGFIEPEQGGDRVFVHINAFAPADRAAGARPNVGERIGFEIGVDAKGRKQARHAVRLERQQRAAAARPTLRRTPAARRREPAATGGPGRLVGALAMLVLVAALGWKGYAWWAAYGPGRSLAALPAPGSGAAATMAGGAALGATAAFRCDGRRYCSQMTSCAEATFFLRNCPGVEMDGDRDGIPCEQQWCTSALAR